MGRIGKSRRNNRLFAFMLFLFIFGNRAAGSGRGTPAEAHPDHRRGKARSALKNRFTFKFFTTMPSNLVATIYQDYISEYTRTLDAKEQRPSEYGALNFMRAQTTGPMSIVDPQTAANIQKSFNNVVKVPVVNYKDMAIGATRTCAMQTEGLTSQIVTLTAVTYAFGFIALPMQHYENFVSYQTAINRLLEAGFQKIAETVDTAAVNFLDTNKNTFFPAKLTDFWPEVGDAFQVPQIEKDDFYNRFADVLRTADFGGPNNVAIVTNHIGMGPVRRLAAQGEGNAVNQGFQLLGYVWYPTNRVTNGGGAVESTGYGAAAGTVALQSRIAPDARQRLRIHESKFWDYMPSTPFTGFDVGVFYQADCTDASALQAAGMAGYTNTKIESWQLSVDVFYIKTYITDTANRYYPIFKFEILA